MGERPADPYPGEWEDRQARAARFEEAVIVPLRTARDHLHWLAVIRRHRACGWLEKLVDAALRMAVDIKGSIVRGDP